MVYLDGKVYAVGGNGNSGINSMEIFDSTTSRWTKQSTPFSYKGDCMTALSANQLILIGGSGKEVRKNLKKKNISIQQFHFLNLTSKSISYKPSFFKF